MSVVVHGRGGARTGNSIGTCSAKSEGVHRKATCWCLRRPSAVELGTSLWLCPFIVFDDADLQQALDALMVLKWRRAGQVCITANRIYLQEGVYEKFEKLIVDATRNINAGHVSTADTTMGPVTTPRVITKVEEQVNDATHLGAKLLHGGKRPDALTGYFYEPTILSEMTADMLVSREETFGPLLALYSFQTESEVVRAVNNTSMGLASCFFTKNVDRTWRLPENLEAGMNGMNTGMSRFSSQLEVSDTFQETNLWLSHHLVALRNLGMGRNLGTTLLSTNISSRKQAP